MEISKDSIVGQVVAKDYRTASVFKSHGIDFCCRGNRSIQDICVKNQLNSDSIIEELNSSMQNTGDKGDDYGSWDMDLLADYIEKKHHRYVEKKIPELLAYLKKIAAVHGMNHPELMEIEALFRESAAELTKHMKKEELILFPYVRKIATNQQTANSPFGSVEDPINMMMHEHDVEGERFRNIAELSNNYTPPQDACTTYRVAFAMLKEFEDDLHQHIHLENNILFPKALASQKVTG